MNFYHILNKDKSEIDKIGYRREIAEMSREIVEGRRDIREEDSVFPVKFGDIKIVCDELDGGILVELIPGINFNPDEEECMEDLKYRATVRNKYNLKVVEAWE